MGEIVGITQHPAGVQRTRELRWPPKDDSPWADRPWRRQMMQVMQVTLQHYGADATEG